MMGNYPVLVSHRHRFIYFKTKKTASTSTEMFFERYCVEDPLHIAQHSTPQLVSNAGIVGSRRRGVLQSDLFYNHMPAEAVLQRAGYQTFESYLKFCNVRNPFDKMVSRFWWILSGRGTITRHMDLTFEDMRKRFNAYIAQSDDNLLDNDRICYSVGGKSVADHYIRYEHLAEDIGNVCSLLDIDYDSSLIGRFNGGVRPSDEPFSAFYEKSSSEKVARIFSWDIQMFGYKL